MWQLAVFFTYSLLAISHSTELIFVQFLESPYHGVKCMDGPKYCSKSEYRSIDGSCNNLEHPEWGMPNRPYGRLLDYNYADGRHTLPTMLSGKPLPSARTVSRELFRTNTKIDLKNTLLTMQHGQFVAHDMSLTADGPQIGVKVHPVVCCRGGKLGPDASNTERCAVIEISPDDPDFGPFNISCFDFTRTATTHDRGCAGPDEVAKPISAVTSWMDLSVVYGSSEKQAKAIRSFECGTLLSVIRNGQEWPPQQENVTKSCPAARSAKEPCYKGGDVRMNQNPELTTLQVIWFREHNRIALALCEANPHWDDETLYQEARRITIAEYQHITYTEYLPIILGKKYMVKEKMLFPNANKCVDDYDSSVDPSVTDEHANGGAFRNFHSAIIGHLQLLDEKRKTTGLARLSDWMNRPLIQEANKTVNLDHLVRGMTTQHEQCVDQCVDEEISTFLFRGKRQRGFDLRSVDIQRSRDHGMGTYVQARKYCGLRIPKSFIDLQRFCGMSKENVKILKKLYERVEDIELLVGGALERLLSGTLSGETFHCILMDTFKRARTADRWWYQNCEENRFTTEQLQTIQQTSMSRIFCDNSKIEYIQPRSFEAISEQNKLTSCKSYTPLFLHYWCEQEYVPHDHTTIDEIEVEVDLEYHPNKTHEIYILRLDEVPVVHFDGRWN